METSQFLVSIALSSLGVLMDLLTTLVFVRDLGLDFEWNRRLKYIVGRWGFKAWILCVEIPIIIGIGLFDAAYSSILLLVGLSWLIGRLFAACMNLRAITIYQTIGIDIFKEQWKSRKQAFRNISFSDKFKLKLPYLMGVTFSFAIFVVLLLISFSAVALVRSLSLGLIIIFLLMIIAT